MISIYFREWEWQERLGRDPAVALGENTKYYLQG